MRRITLIAAAVLATTACKRPEGPRPPPAPAAPVGTAASSAAMGASVLRGKVLERIDVPQYSYLRLSTASGEVWAAVERTDKKPGDEVGVANPLPMQGFESKELNRKFDLVYFGTLAAQGGEAAARPSAAGGQGGAPVPEKPVDPNAMAAQHRAAATGTSNVKVAKVARAEGPGGRTVAEIWAQRQQLKGKTVSVRGTVVKSTPVMGRVFLHLRDGSGSLEKQDNDVTVTTSEPVGVGDVVVAQGTVALDRDVGAGYAYPVLIENAKVSK
jgi:hypothetical protein